jgi:hypothetical protein
MTNAETNDKAPAVAEQGAHDAAKEPPSKKAAPRKKGAPKSQKTANGAKPKKTARATKKTAKPGRKTTGPRVETKGAKILEMIGRTKGATLAEIMKATGWQPHSVRGFLSTAAKKRGLKIESVKNEAGCVYKIGK